MPVVFVSVALVRVVHVPRLVAVVLVSVALMRGMTMLFGMVFVAVALVKVVDVAGLVAVVFVVVTFVDIVCLHWLFLPN